MSSCQEKSNEISIDLKDLQNHRAEEVYTISKAFLLNVINNLCVLEGVSGNIDLALEIDRKKSVLRAMKEIVKEMEDSYE